MDSSIEGMDTQKLKLLKLFSLILDCPALTLLG